MKLFQPHSWHQATGQPHPVLCLYIPSSQALLDQRGCPKHNRLVTINTIYYSRRSRSMSWIAQDQALPYSLLICKSLLYYQLQWQRNMLVATLLAHALHKETLMHPTYFPAQHHPLSLCTFLLSFWMHGCIGLASTTFDFWHKHILIKICFARCKFEAVVYSAQKSPFWCIC